MARSSSSTGCEDNGLCSGAGAVPHEEAASHEMLISCAPLLLLLLLRGRFRTAACCCDELGLL